MLAGRSAELALDDGGAIRFAPALSSAPDGRLARRVARALAAEAPQVEALARAAKTRDLQLVYIAARGTSDHAAILAKYLFEIELGLPVCLAAPSVFTLYDAPVRLDKALVLGISQSGEAADAKAGPVSRLRTAREELRA